MFFCKVYESDEDETFYDARSRPESPCVWGLKGGGGGQNNQQDPDFNGASDLSPAR